ncbi:hypothetical protein [Variovorax ginsengisoli]|uniref:Uncharacterized protein n=1 Tax=Variovorax ginsengisoli TaxID=363844 RepID=A0ABT8SE28_9BURK|nr:hypothetical protein [Variovorax ginsengisoli]MDN8617815.1 hypothetical protein [Variovorax ginsengisoli]MDO1536985.1 hypothetical protein [Variovorax ginsengisoli]
MKERFATIGTLVCLTVLTGLTLVFALAIFPGTEAIRWFFVTSAMVLARLDAPAWVQAIGSIAAIAGAVGTVMYQNAKQHARDRMAAREKDESIERMAVEIANRLRQSAAEMHFRFGRMALNSLPLQAIKHLDELRRPLEEVPFWNSSDYEFVNAAMSLRADLSWAILEAPDVNGKYAVELITDACTRFFTVRHAQRESKALKQEGRHAAALP